MLDKISTISNIFGIITNTIGTIVTLISIYCSSKSNGNRIPNNANNEVTTPSDIKEYHPIIKSLLKIIEENSAIISIIYFLLSLYLIKYNIFLYIFSFIVCVLTLVSLGFNKQVAKIEHIIISLFYIVLFIIQLFFLIMYNNNYSCMLFFTINLLMIIIYNFVYALKEIINYRKSIKGETLEFSLANKVTIYLITFLVSCVCIIVEFHFKNFEYTFIDSLVSLIENIFS